MLSPQAVLKLINNTKHIIYLISLESKIMEIDQSEHNGNLVAYAQADIAHLWRHVFIFQA